MNLAALKMDFRSFLLNNRFDMISPCVSYNIDRFFAFAITKSHIFDSFCHFKNAMPRYIVLRTRGMVSASPPFHVCRSRIIKLFREPFYGSDDSSGSALAFLRG